MEEYNHNKYMRMAFEQAALAEKAQEVPIGAVIVAGETGEVIAKAHNQTITLSDPSAHAEILAIRAACQVKDTQRIPDCVLYVTLEPCAMCAAAISYARLSHIYYGAADPKSGGLNQGPKIYDHATIHHKPDVTGGIMAEECGQILSDFFKARRDKNA